MDEWIITALTDNKLLLLFQDPLGNMLSAEAKVFVPRQQHGSTDVVENGLLSPGATSGSMTDGLLDGEGQYPGQHPVNGRPGYITTCYPFVSGADPRYSMGLNPKCILMDSVFWFDTINLRYPLYYRSSDKKAQ